MRTVADCYKRKRISVRLCTACVGLCFLAALNVNAAPKAASSATPNSASLKSELAPLKSKSVPAIVAKAAEAALAAFAKNDLETARKEFNRLLALDPDNLTGLVNLGTVEYRLKNLPEAERLLKRAIRLEPETALAWFTLGVVYWEQQKVDASLAALSQAVYLNPKNASAHNYLAVVIGKKGWSDGAEQEFEKAIELAPESADAHFNLALLYIQRDPPSVELARRHYQKALALGAAPDPLVDKALSESKK